MIIKKHIPITMVTEDVYQRHRRIMQKLAKVSNAFCLGYQWVTLRETCTDMSPFTSIVSVIALTLIYDYNSDIGQAAALHESKEMSLVYGVSSIVLGNWLGGGHALYFAHLIAQPRSQR